MASGTRTTVREGAGGEPAQRAAAPAAHPVLELARRAGNRATAALIQRARVVPPVAATTAADPAAAAINTWIQNNAPPGQQANYSVGVATNGDIYISKVGGVTTRTPFVGTTLRAWIIAQGYDTGRDIILAKQYNRSLSSGNHAEMCIMAAAGQGNLTKIYCAAPHCAFCAAQMQKDNIALGAAVGGTDQNGWAHPFAPVLFGSAIHNDTDAQLVKLGRLPTVPTAQDAAAARAGWYDTVPQGDYEHLC